MVRGSGLIKKTVLGHPERLLSAFLTPGGFSKISKAPTLPEKLENDTWNKVMFIYAPLIQNHFYDLERAWPQVSTFR